MKEKLTIYESLNECDPCTLIGDQKTKAKDWFMSNKWRINFETSDGSTKDIAEVTITDNKFRTINSDSIKMKAVDSVGKSELEGILMYKRDYFALYFFKNYYNKHEAGQTGSFQWLIYDGVQQGDRFKGNWHYEGYETNPKYSGTWEMVHN